MRHGVLSVQVPSERGAPVTDNALFLELSETSEAILPAARPILTNGDKSKPLACGPFNKLKWVRDEFNIVGTANS